MAKRPWLLGEIETPTAVDLLRDIVYHEQGSPQQLAAVEAGWRWLTHKSIQVEVTCVPKQHAL
jgi:hypothetical protein